MLDEKGTTMTRGEFEERIRERVQKAVDENIFHLAVMANHSLIMRMHRGIIAKSGAVVKEHSQWRQGASWTCFDWEAEAPLDIEGNSRISIRHSSILVMGPETVTITLRQNTRTQHPSEKIVFDADNGTYCGNAEEQHPDSQLFVSEDRRLVLRIYIPGTWETALQEGVLAQRAAEYAEAKAKEAKETVEKDEETKRQKERSRPLNVGEIETARKFSLL